MKVQVNGEQSTVREGLTVAELVTESGLADRRVAVELNRNVLARDRWASTELREDDVVEIVHFVGGG